MCFLTDYKFWDIILKSIIALFGGIIAWKQFKLHTHKAKLEIYERRIKIYYETKMFLSKMVREAKVSHSDLSTFYISVTEADFLFDSTIRAYLNEIHKRASKFMVELDNVEGDVDDLVWFKDQLDESVNVFKTSLDLSKL